MLAEQNSSRSSTTIFNCVAFRTTIWREHWFRSHFPLSVRSSVSYASRVNQKVVFFTPPWNASKSWGCEISDNRRSLDAIDEWIHRTAYGARPGSISLFPDFRLFFWSTLFRHVDCALSRDPTGRYVGFVSPEYWNIRIIRYADPIWSKMKERLWFTVCQHWFRYLCALCW